VNQNELGPDVDLTKLSEDLARVRLKLQEQAAQTITAEQQAEIGQVASAEIAAKKGDRKGVVQFLKTSGKWAFDAATEIGTDLAAEVIKKSAGL
jgi:hypothetical protein